MAEPFEFEIKPKGIDSTVRELRQLEGQLDEVSGSMDGAGSSSSNMAQNITAGVVAAQAAYAVMTKLASAVGEAAAEFERQAGIMNRFTGDVTEAARRTNGLITQLDLMAAQSRASAAGLELTADQFATISVRASEFAARTGGDATEALNGLMGAIATGRAGQLLQYGVDLQGITSITDKQTAAIDGLTRGYEDAESSADTFGGRLQVLSNEMDNQVTAAIAVVNEYGGMERAFDNFAIAADALSGSTRESTNELSGMEQAALGATIQIEMLAESAAYYSRIVRAMVHDGSQEAMIASARELQAIMGEGRDTRNTGERFVAAQQDILARRAMPGDGQGALDDRGGGFRMQADFNPAAGGRNRGGRSGGGGSSESAPDTSAQDALNRLIEEQLALEDQLLDNNANKQAIAGELAILERERLDLMAQQTAEAAKQKDALEQAAAAEAERQDNMRSATRAQDAVTQGLEGIASVTKRTIALTEEGGMSTKEAFKTAIDEWLKQLAIQEAWKGAASTVEAIGLAITNPPAAGTKVAEAAGHFAIAAAAGGASAAIPNASAGGGAEATRPTDANAGGGANTGGGANINIAYNSPVPPSQIGASQARASRDAARRFGS